MINSVNGGNLKSLLVGENSEQRRFVIPEYQRDYKWRKEEISQFITDIFEAYGIFKEDKNYNYFFGAIITEKQEKTQAGFTEYHLIDGQQRITTSILFIKLLQEYYLEQIKALDPTDEDIQDLLGALRHALWVDGKTNNNFCKLISKKDSDSSDLERVLAKESVHGEHNFSKNYHILRKEYEDAIKDQEKFQLEEFIKFIFNNLEFVQVDTSSREEALKIFSVLNTRGLDLDSTDIIKAEAMALLPQEKHRDFSTKWKKLQKQAEDLKVPLETIFRYYINMYRPVSIKGTNNSNVKEIWKEYGFTSNISLALEDFEKFTECLQYIWSMTDPYIWCLRHLLTLGKNAYTWIPVLVTMKYNNYTDQEIHTIAKFITKWHYLIHGWTVEKIKSFNFALIKLVNEKKSIEDILKQKPRILTNDDYTEEWLVNQFSITLKKTDIYYARWGRPLLLFLHNLALLEHHGKEQSFTFKPLTTDNTIEHIRPQNSTDSS
ncbi:MAG: DUF262 domain-containing protein [Brevinema sp.]